MGSKLVEIAEVDVLLVGAGFAAFTLMNKLRKQGLRCKIYEKGSASGGVWYWNCYPGVRSDSEYLIYQLFDKELWEGFAFKERYPGPQELRRYFEHVEKTWDLNKDIVFNRRVDAAVFDEKRHQWLVSCADGSQICCRWFIPCIGFTAGPYSPAFQGLSDFKGETYHTAVWPKRPVNLNNKRIAVVGTGASGVQCIQEIGPHAAHLTVYQRTPNLCLPMNQGTLDPEEEEQNKKAGKYEEAFAKTRKTFAGFNYEFLDKKVFDDSPEEREKLFHLLMVQEGGFRFWLGTYKDVYFDQEANDEAYNFWMKTVRKRIPDKKKQELLAPKTPPHPWGTKRPSLEQNFYEVVSLPHVDIVDVNKDPIVRVTETGICTESGEVDVDVIILATGFQSGPLAGINIQGTGGGTVADHWQNGTKTAIGIAIPEFPNMFFMYGPQAPTAFCNGPSCIQIQADFVDGTIKDLRAKGITRFEATAKAEEDWCHRVKAEWDASLFPRAKSWYQDANLPGKRVEPLYWVGGSLAYQETLAASVANNYQGWVTAKS